MTAERDAYSWEIQDRHGTWWFQFAGDEEVGEWARDWEHRPDQIAGIIARPASDLKPSIGIAIPDGARAVYRWQRSIHLDPNTGRQWLGARTLTIGAETDRGGFYLHIDEAGNVTACDEPNPPAL